MLLGGINRRLSPSTSVSGEFRGLQPESKPSFKQDLFMFTTLSPTARACAWSNILRSATAAALAAVCLVPLASQAQDAEIKMFAPVNGQRVGVGGFGWFVDLAIDFDVPLKQTGFTGVQLTGPGAHNSVRLMPGLIWVPRLRRYARALAGNFDEFDDSDDQRAAAGHPLVSE